MENYLLEEKLETTIFLLGKCQKKRPETIEIDYGLNSAEFLKVIKDQFLKNDSKNNLKLIPQFVPVDFQFLMCNKGSPFPVDFYLRIKRPDDECQYLKRLHANDLFASEEIENFKKHNVKYLYVLKNDYKKFLEVRLSLSFEKKENESTNILIKSFDYHLTKEVIALTGIDEETQQLVKTNITHMEDAISKNESLMNYLKLIKLNQNSYSYARSVLVAMILNKVVNSFDWNSKTIKEKICYLAFLHDISIVDDRLTKVHSDEELFEDFAVEYEFQSNSKLTDKKFKAYEIEQIQHHALNSALILEKIENVPDGVYQMVKEHHGSKNGIGFKDHQSIALQPLSMLFIVVEDFVVHLLKFETPTKDDIQKIVQVLAQKYTKGNYKKAVEALLQITA